MTIYHNHIPRTSGFVINKYVSEHTSLKSLIIDPTQIIENNIFLNKDYISGHIGNYPKKFLSDIISFSLVRDPYEQFMSWFYFMWLQGVEWEDNKIIKSYYGTAKEFMDIYINTDEYIDGLSNIQTKFLTGSIDKNLWNKTKEPIEKTKLSWCLTDYNITKDAIDTALQENIVHTVNNRMTLKNKIKKISQEKFGVLLDIQDLNFPGHNTPKNHGYIFDMPESWKQKILSVLEYDYYLFKRVTDIENNML